MCPVLIFDVSVFVFVFVVSFDFNSRCRGQQLRQTLYRQRQTDRVRCVINTCLSRFDQCLFSIIFQWLMSRSTLKTKHYTDRQRQTDKVRDVINTCMSWFDLTSTFFSQLHSIIHVEVNTSVFIVVCNASCLQDLITWQQLVSLAAFS